MSRARDLSGPLTFPHDQGDAQHLHTIFEHANDAILLIDPEQDRILEANSQAARMLGYGPAELIRDVRISSVHPHEMERLRQFAHAVQTTGEGWTDELSCTRKDGQRLPSEISASVVQVDGRDCIVAMVRDVSARKAAEDALRRSEARFRAFVENAGDGFFLVASDGVILDTNARAAEMLGYARADELIGCSVLAIDVGLSPETFSQLLSELEVDQPRLIESRHRRRDGSVFPSEVSICAYGEAQAPSYIALLRDISQRKAAEEALARLAEMGEFAAMMVHQIRNPLSTIRMALDHVAGQSLPESATKRIDLAQREADRLSRLLEDVLAYAGRRAASPTRLEVDALIGELLPSLQALPIVTERALRVELGLVDCSIHADPAQLREVLVNLIVNACEAVAPGEPVWLRTGRQPGTETPLIEVGNGGEPIPPDVLARIGQPFFSTKASGNGLGVAFVRRVAAAHHWTFSLQSDAATGTVARLLM
ncbi:MAG: PAS domain S-box protein [Gammaproteobacteria bacterium]|jgi:PAS domain S-box-containing protein|nr:PAS domain S-box protein [Gammaproteobacteria bacterium]